MNYPENQSKPAEFSEDLLTDPPFYLPEFEASFRYIIDEYTVTPRDVAIFIPCAMRKPYSTSPSHKLIRKIISDVLLNDTYHIIVFGTCGILPSELETMYPYAHYRYMLGKCKDDTVKEDFLRIETARVAEYLQKTKELYRYRIAYCIGLFREAFIHGSEEASVPIDILLPTRDLINQIIEEDCPFQEGSLSMDEYLEEFYHGLLKIRSLLESDPS